MFRLSMSSLLVLLLAMAACQQESPSQQAKPPAAPSAGTDETYTPAAADSHPVDVQVTKPTRRKLLYQVTLPANISPLYQTTLYAKVSGYLKWIGPDKGDAVNGWPKSGRNRRTSSPSRISMLPRPPLREPNIW